MWAYLSHAQKIDFPFQWGEIPEELTNAQVLFTDSTDYLLGGAVTLTNRRMDKCFFDGGYCQFTQSDNDFASTAEPLAIYYYNQDHLGNIREVVDADGNVVQVTNYYPFGTPYSDSSATLSPSLQEHKYNGKELDTMHGLNTYDYGARQNYSILGRWDRIDPLCGKYYSVSPYVYCMNNPVKFVDPDGRKIVLTENCSDGFKEQFYNAFNYLQSHNAAGVWMQLDERPEVITIYEHSGKANYKTGNEIHWNPYSGLFTFDGGNVHHLSPAIRLLHEMGHKLQELTGEYKTKEDDSVWQYPEERRNILEVETPAA